MSAAKPGIEAINGGTISQALAGAKTSDAFFKALDKRYQSIPDRVAMEFGTKLANMLQAHTNTFKGEDRLVAEIALLLAVAANLSCDLVTAVEPAVSLADTNQDGRLIAVRKCFGAILDDARFARTAARLMTSTGGSA